MIDSETVTLDVLKVTVSREQFAESVAVVARALSTRTSVLVLGGIQLPRPPNGARARRDRHGALAPRVARGRRRRRGDGRRPGPAAARHRPRAARVGRLDRASARGVGARDHERLGELPHPHVLGRGLPAPARPRGGSRSSRSTASAARDDRAGSSRSASRDESRPVLTGIFVELRARQARDGRDGLLPARGQGDRRSEPAARARGDHPGPRAPGARADRRLGATRSSSACRRTTSSSASTAPG